jgi:aminobenzoyl-glutamate utilization protein B
MTAMGKSALAKRGMRTAAKVIAMTALDFMINTALVEQAKRDHLEVLGGNTYRSVIAEDVKPGEQL